MFDTLNDLGTEKNKARIAIIEDDMSIHDLIVGSMLLEVEFVDAYQFTNAHDAIHDLWLFNLIEPPQIDALFIDIFLEKETSGMEVLEYCQFIPKEIPIVMMSSRFSRDHLEKIEKLHLAPVLLRKPFGPEQIIQLTKWLFKNERGGNHGISGERKMVEHRIR